MTANRKLLITEDCPEDVLVIRKLAESLGMITQSASTLGEGYERLKSESFDFLLTDLHINSRAGVDVPDGLTIIREAKIHQPNLTIIAMSNDPRIDIWQAAQIEGAHHFIRKPVIRADELVIAFQLAIERKRFVTCDSNQSSARSNFEAVFKDYPEGIIIAESDLRKVKGLARRRNLDCVVSGETGTGKEEIAKLIHRYRYQSEGSVPFVAINCATISSSLAESVLFGHKKGAFTGADRTTVGYIGEADGGILFLDEIHALDIVCQQKLLRVLADGSYSRLGETREYHSSFQLVAATTKDLDDEVDNGKFLIDLRGRLTGVEINLLPLRERLQDIPAFVSLFLARNSLEIEYSEYLKICILLQSFYWRGNIRQLFKLLDTWVALCDFDEKPLTADHIPIFKGMLPPVETSNIYPKFDLKKEHVENSAAQQPTDFALRVEAFEKTLLQEELLRHRSISECAAALNLPRSTLDAKRRKYNLLQF